MGGFENIGFGFKVSLAVKSNPEFSSSQRIWLVKLKVKSLQTNKRLQPLLYLELQYNSKYIKTNTTLTFSLLVCYSLML